MRRYIQYFIATAIAFSLNSKALAEIMVVGHMDLPTARLEQKEVRALFLNKATKDLNPRRMLLISPSLESSAGEYFLKNILRMTPSKFKSYWASQTFSGKGSEPTYSDSLDEVLGIISENVNAIAVIDTLNAPEGVKLLFSLDSLHAKDIISQLQRLQALRDGGALTKKEFQAAKKKLLEK